MANPPRFWRHGGGQVWPALLWPASLAVGAATARRVARPGWRAPVPVICCGNAGVGGAGKTTLALDIGTRLAARGAMPHFLIRGHGGRLRGPVRADPERHSARDVGDEALLLAGIAPCWVGADRAATARLASDAGAGVLVLDDGMQNATLEQDWKLLVIDGAYGFGNKRVLPAGPLRETISRAAARASAAVLIGADQTNAAAALPRDLPVHRARLRPPPGIERFGGRRLLAFAGIGRPDKFFGMLGEAGLDVVATRPFADHHVFSSGELARLRADAARLKASLVTTPKDHARLSAGERAGIDAIGVTLVWDDEPAWAAYVDEMLGR